MSPFIPIVLALLAALIGLLGNTTDPEKPHFRRLTRVGYVALCLILATSAVGLWTTRSLVVENKQQQVMRAEVREYALAQIQKFCCMALEPYYRIVTKNFEYSEDEEFIVDSTNYFHISTKDAGKLLDQKSIDLLSSLNLGGEILYYNELSPETDDMASYARIIAGANRNVVCPSITEIRSDLGPYLEPRELVLINKISNHPFLVEMNFAIRPDVAAHQMPLDVAHSESGINEKILPPLEQYVAAYKDYISSLIELLSISEKYGQQSGSLVGANSAGHN